MEILVTVFMPLAPTENKGGTRSFRREMLTWIEKGMEDSI